MNKKLKNPSVVKKMTMLSSVSTSERQCSNVLRIPLIAYVILTKSREYKYTHTYTCTSLPYVTHTH